MPGAIGLVQLDHSETDQLEQTEAIRVCHSIERSGSSLPFCAGAEFLVLDAAPAASMRATACRLIAETHWNRPGAGENSGVTMTGPKGPSHESAQVTGAIPRDGNDV
jgi:hypothetical protein